MSSECWNPIYHIGPEFVLCGSSALEFMGLFAGYINASTVYEIGGLILVTLVMRYRPPVVS